MARFYGTVQGARGEATRLGHADLHVTAQSFAGDVVVKMWRDNDDKEWVEIGARKHDGGGSTHCLYLGKVADLLSMPARHAKLQALGMDEFIRQHEMEAV